MRIASFADSLTSEFFYREAQVRQHARPDALAAGPGAQAREKWERLDVMRRSERECARQERIATMTALSSGNRGARLVLRQRHRCERQHLTLDLRGRPAEAPF